jgi:SAM-dependent methyltransferase
LALEFNSGEARVRQQSYLEHGSTFLDRFRTRLVCGKVLRRLPKRNGLKVLDLGCGFHATYLRAIGPRLAQGVGIDFSVSEGCRHDPRFRFVLGSVESVLPQQDSEAFDVVLFISVLEHMWDPVTCLIHCHRVLKGGGVLLINVPTWYAKPVLELSAFKLGTSPACEMDDHKMYYSKTDLWPLLVKAGFKPSRIRLNYQYCLMTLFASAVK